MTWIPEVAIGLLAAILAVLAFQVRRLDRRVDTMERRVAETTDSSRSIPSELGDLRNRVTMQSGTLESLGNQIRVLMLQLDELQSTRREPEALPGQADVVDPLFPPGIAAALPMVTPPGLSEPDEQTPLTRERAATLLDAWSLKSDLPRNVSVIRLNWAGHERSGDGEMRATLTTAQQVGDFLGVVSDRAGHVFPNPKAGQGSAGFDVVFPPPREGAGAAGTPVARVIQRLDDTNWMVVDE